MENVPAIKKDKAYLRIVDIVIQMIAEGKVDYNEKFYNEQDLMGMLGVSRPTLREALRVLEFLDVINVSPRNGISIKAPSSHGGYPPLLYILAFEKTTGREIFELREALQLEMAALAAKNRSAKDLADLEDLLQNMEQQLDAELDAFSALDYQFHLRIIEAAGNHLVMKLMNTISPVLYNQLLRHGEKESTKQRRATLNEHRSIVKKIAEQDSTAARAAMEQHLTDSRRDAQLETDLPVHYFR